MSAIDSSFHKTVTHQTETLTLTISGNHHERIKFLVFSQPSSPVVLGLRWLKLHNPHLYWISSSIVSWSLHTVYIYTLSIWPIIVILENVTYRHVRMS